MRRYVTNVAAEIFIWMLLSAFVEVAVTATVERISLGDRYVLAGVPFWSLQGHTTLWVVVVAVGLTFGLRALVAYFEKAGSRSPLRRLWVQGVVAPPDGADHARVRAVLVPRRDLRAPGLSRGARRRAGGRVVDGDGVRRDRGHRDLT
jgi:hypothetical protein